MMMMTTTKTVPSNICVGLAYIDYIHRLTVGQINTLLVLKKLGNSTRSSTIADRLGYTADEITKVITGLQNCAHGRPLLITGQRAPKGSGKGNPKLWSLSAIGDSLISQYLEQLET